MKKIFYIFFLTTLFSCTDDPYILGPSATVNLNINATFFGEPLVIGKTYQYPDGHKIRFDEFSFFVANVVLKEAETSDELDLLEVGLADFSGNTDPNNVQPATFTIHSVPGGEYKGLELKVGVPSKFNKASILEYGTGHPVRQAYDTHFWPEDGSFFFMKMAGVYDLNSDGVFAAFPEDHPFELFPAGNDNYTSLTFSHPFTIVDNVPFNLNLSIDLGQLFMDQSISQPLDLGDTANLSTYDPENEALSSFVMGNLVRALKVK